MPGFALQNSSQPLAPAALGAGASGAAVNVDVTGCDFAVLQVTGTSGGTIAGANGLQLKVLRRVGPGPAADTVPIGAGGTLTFTAINQTLRFSRVLPPGRYALVPTNLDQSNGLAAAQLDLDTYLRS